MCTLDLFPVPNSFTLSQVNFTKASPPTSYTHHLESNHGRTAWHSSYQAGSSVWQDGISPSQSENAVHPLENYPILEDSKRTEALAGATFVQAVKLEYEGKKAIIFAFSVNISPLFYPITRLSDCFLSGFGGEDRRYFHSEIQSL